MHNHFSLRTLMLAVLGTAMLCGLFTCGAASAVVAHIVLVMAFAIPGARFGYDLGRTSRSAVVGLCVAASAGTLALGASVLALDWWRVLQ
jgi:hypothetical protein